MTASAAQETCLRCGGAVRDDGKHVVAPTGDPDFISETGSVVRHGVCLDCGEGVLRSGEHISGRYEPCATYLGREPKAPYGDADGETA